MSGQTYHEADPEDPVQDPLPGSRPTHQRQVLAHPGEHCVTFPLPETKDVLALSTLISKRACSPRRSRFSGHGRTSWQPVLRRAPSLQAQMILPQRRSGRTMPLAARLRARHQHGVAGWPGLTTIAPMTAEIRQVRP